MSKKLLLLACLLILIGCKIEDYPTFQQYLQIYNKTYEEPEYSIRKQTYENRLKSFQNITGYTPGINYRSDWSASQIQASKTLQSIPQIQRQSPGKVKAARLGAATSLDWSAKNAVTSVKDQGSCGCCWAFASCAYAQSRLILTNSKYTVDNIDLSEQYLLKCTKYSDCQGGYLEYAMQTVTEVPTEDQFPYSPYSSNSGICWASGVRTGYTPQSLYSLSDNQLITLLQDSPVAIAISSVGWESYGSGVFSCSPSAAIDHAVLLVGYTDTYWIVKNQWGKSWGQNGYIRITRNTNANCKIGNAAHILFSTLFYKVTALVFIFFIAFLY